MRVNKGGDMRLTCSFLFPLALIVATVPIAESGGGKKKEPTVTLEEAFRKWDAGFASDKKHDRLAALRAMFPVKEEIAYLFPKQVDKLWPKFEEGHKFLEENVDAIAKEITRGGAITKIQVIDLRKENKGPAKELLAIIPKDVGVFDLTVHREKSTSGSGTYLFMKNRWFFIKDLETIPPILDKLE